MAQTGYTPIFIYSSSTTTNSPTAGNLTNSTLGSELAINIADGKLFYKDNANAIQVIGWKIVPATAGGTGQTSYAIGDLLYADTTTTLAKLADTATGNALISGGVGVAPSWGKIGLTTHISGVLSVANGGTNASTASITAFNNITGYTAAGATGTTSTNLVFSTSPTITTPSITGDATLSTGNLVVGTSGKGIDFSATPNTGTSELLADYEEGTWTPQYTNGTPPTTPYTMDTVSATYTKIGRQVTVTAYIRTSNVNTAGASGVLLISGLPYTVSSWSSISIGYATAFGGSYPISGYANQTGTTISLTYRTSVNGSTSECSKTDLTSGIGAANSLIFSATYFV